MQDGVSVKGGGIRGRKGVERWEGFYYSFYERGERILGESLEYWAEWNLQCTGGCWRFWARRARISVDIIGLGATSQQGGWFWVVS
jgi:hypothetical protein